MATLAMQSAQIARAMSFATLRGFFAVGTRLAPHAIAPLAERLFCMPLGARRLRVDTRDIPTGEPFVLRFAERRIAGHVWRADAGRPRVLLAHGWAGTGLQLAAFVAPLLEAGFEVVTFDQPAHGKSSGRWTTLPEFARTYARVSAALGPFDAVVAHSLGAAAVALALSHGLPARRVVLIAAPTDARQMIRGFARAMWLSDEVLARMMQSIEVREGVKFADLKATRIAPHIVQPALLIHDRDDRVVPYASLSVYAGAWRNHSVLATEGLGHHRILHDPGVIHATVDYLTSA
jgi:pimeloyl-ACP methyl ester carboxylesterase